jgi:hypothetical protein
MNLLLTIIFTIAIQLQVSIIYSQPPHASYLVEDTLYDSKYFIIFNYSPMIDSLSLVEVNSKFGIVNSKGQMMVPLEYEQISLDFNSRARHLFQKQCFNKEYYFSEDNNRSKEQEKQLFEQELNNPESSLSSMLEFLKNPFFVAKKDKKWGVINKSNNTIVPFDYDYMQEVAQNTYLVKRMGKYGVVDSRNIALVPLICDTIILMSLPPFPRGEGMENFDPLAYGLLKADNKYGIISLFTEEVLLPIYDQLEHCFASYKEYCVCGFSQEYDWQKTSYKTDKTHPFYNIIKYRQDNKYGLFNLVEMHEITGPVYDSIMFEYGGILVKLDNKYSFITRDSLQLYSNTFDEIDFFIAWQTSFLKVKNENMVGILDINGTTILKLEWDDIKISDQAIDRILKYEFIVMRKGKVGIVNSQKKLTPIKYDRIVWDVDYQTQSRYYILYKKNRSKKFLIEYW